MLRQSKRTSRCRIITGGSAQNCGEFMDLGKTYGKPTKSPHKNVRTHTSLWEKGWKRVILTMAHMTAALVGRGRALVWFFRIDFLLPGQMLVGFPGCIDVPVRATAQVPPMLNNPWPRLWRVLMSVTKLRSRWLYPCCCWREGHSGSP